MMAAYPLLGLLWFAVLNQFYGAMKPRFSHLGAAGNAINDWPCGCPQCDFSGFWPAGLLARAHQLTTLYQPAAFLAYRHGLFSPQAERVLWYYPPPALLPSMAISYLPFEAAFFVWVTGLTLATLLLLRWAGLSWVVLGLTLLSPALLWNIELGQLGAISNGFVVSGLLMADQAPWTAGIVLGLLVFKPQSGLLTPIALLARSNVRALAAAALVVLTVLAAVTAIFGWRVWAIYYEFGRQSARSVLETPMTSYSSERFGVSVFWMVRSLGASLTLSYALQTVAALAAALLTWRIWGSGIDRVDRMALTVFLCLLATPYGYTADMVGWSVAHAALAERRGWRIGLLDALFWLWPALCPIVTGATGILFTPVIVALAVLRTYQASMAHLPGRAAVLPGSGA